MTEEPSNRIIRLPTVLNKTGLSRSTLYRKMEAGTFPRNLQISRRCAGWREADVDVWLRNPMFYSVTDQANQAQQ
jgi:prophage regulatory protein